MHKRQATGLERIMRRHDFSHTRRSASHGSVGVALVDGKRWSVFTARGTH